MKLALRYDILKQYVVMCGTIVIRILTNMLNVVLTFVGTIVAIIDLISPLIGMWIGAKEVTTEFYGHFEYGLMLKAVKQGFTSEGKSYAMMVFIVLPLIAKLIARTIHLVSSFFVTVKPWSLREVVMQTKAYVEADKVLIKYGTLEKYTDASMEQFRNSSNYYDGSCSTSTADWTDVTDSASTTGVTDTADVLGIESMTDTGNVTDTI